MQPDWVRGIREQCRKAGVPFFFKQWGGVQKGKAGRMLDGRTFDEIPKWKVRLTPPRETRDAAALAMQAVVPLKVMVG